MTSGLYTTPANIPNPSVLRRKRRRKLVMAIAAVVFLLVAAGATVYLWFNRPAPSEAIAQQAPTPPKTATLVISVSPPVGLTIEIDGDKKGGNSPVTVSDLEAGTHTLEISHPHFKTYKAEVEMRPGGFKSLDIELEAAAQGAR